MDGLTSSAQSAATSSRWRIMLTLIYALRHRVSECAFDGLWFVLNNQEKCPGRTLGAPPSLFPIAQRTLRNAKSPRKLVLSKSQATANVFYVDIGRDVNAKFLQIRFFARKSESLLCALQNTGAGFAGFLHVQLRCLRALAFICPRQTPGSAVNVFLSSLRCSRDKLAYVSLLYISSRNTGMSAAA